MRLSGDNVRSATVNKRSFTDAQPSAGVSVSQNEAREFLAGCRNGGRFLTGEARQ
jgi:hypothetical protein